MGPVFNADQCFICHSQPAIGGSSPAVNPANVIAHRLGGTNTVPDFEAPNGAFRETRFKFNPDGSRDGGVHSLFTVQGRSDAPDCKLNQPDFVAAVRDRNIAFRIPLQLFGLGLIESIPDTAIRNNMKANAEQKKELGISGHPNMVANNGTVGRFGWKAQNELRSRRLQERLTTWKWESPMTCFQLRAAKRMAATLPTNQWMCSAQRG